MTRLNILFAVACVGNPMKSPLLSFLYANCSAPTKAASVLPNPIGASKIIKPGLLISSIVSANTV